MDNSIADKIPTISKVATAREVSEGLQKISTSRWSKFLLSILLRKDKKKRTYIEHFLAKYCGEQASLPLSAKLIYPFFKHYLDRILEEFDVEKEELIQVLSSTYAKKVIANLIKGFKLFGIRTPFTSGAPILVVWDFTYRCNLRCKHCYANAGTNFSEMTKEEKLRALDILVDAGVAMLALSGGEPLLGVGFWDVLNTAHDYGLYLSIATNGTLITEEVAERLAKSGLEYAQVSLDSPDPEFHDTFRGVPGAWSRAIKGIRNLKKYGIMVEISMTITKQNYRSIPRMIEFVRDSLKADLFMAFNFVPTGRGKNIISWDLSPEKRWEALTFLSSTLYNGFAAASTAPQYAIVAFEYGQKIGENPKIAGHFYTIDMRSNRFGSMLEFLGGCGAGRVYLALEPNGDIYPCVFLRKKIGNILQDDFEELWKNNQFLEELRNRDLLKGECGSCQYKYICGGCRARAYNYFGDHLASDPGC
ncbi:MAG: radical SAM protein, partial [Candidatus Njordarchaeota archaeon]